MRSRLFELLPAFATGLNWFATRLAATVAAVCFGIGVASSVERGAEPLKASDYSAEEMIALLVDHLSSIESVRCEYDVRFSGSPSVIHARFARSGGKWHYAELSSDKNVGTSKENVSSNDGEFAYAYATSRSKEGRTTWTSVHLQDPRPQASLDPDHLLGVKLSNISRSITDVLKNSRVTKEDAILPDGTLGALLTAHSVSADRGGDNVPKYDVAVTLDPVHDWLPCDILITQAEPPLAPENWRQQWVIHDYRRVRDERVGLDRWFPVSGELRQKADAPTIELHVTDAHVNPHLSDTLFRPEIPDGVVLADTTSSGRGRLALKGREFMEDAKMDDLTANGRMALATTSPETWKIALALIGALVVALLSVLAVRCQKQPARQQGESIL